MNAIEQTTHSLAPCKQGPKTLDIPMGFRHQTTMKKRLSSGLKLKPIYVVRRIQGGYNNCMYNDVT